MPEKTLTPIIMEFLVLIGEDLRGPISTKQDLEKSPGQLRQPNHKVHKDRNWRTDKQGGVRRRFQAALQCSPVAGRTSVDDGSPFGLSIGSSQIPLRCECAPTRSKPSWRSSTNGIVGGKWATQRPAKTLLPLDGKDCGRKPRSFRKRSTAAMLGGVVRGGRVFDSSAVLPAHDWLHRPNLPSHHRMTCFRESSRGWRISLPALGP